VERSDVNFKRLEQPRAFEEIVSQIQEAIIEGRLRPNDRLPPERVLATTFGVSRASVREALRALEVFGVVMSRRGTGPLAGSIVADSAAEGVAGALQLHIGLLQIPMADMVEVRTVLETHAARLAALHRDADHIKTLSALVDQMRAANDIRSCHDADTEFHVELARASGNALLPVFMEGLRSAMRRDMMSGYDQLDDWRQTRDRLVIEHGKILTFIAAGHADSAADAVVSHIKGFYDTVLDRS
jgi:GntR family transcriptional regulator, transcriptional repressor for pyruvate dehydrogenase complex